MQTYMYHSCIGICMSLIVYSYHVFTSRCHDVSATLHRMRVWPVSSLQMVSFHDWPLHSMRTADMFWNSVTTSQGSIQVLRNAWNLVASGVMLLLNVFLHIVYLCVRAVPMSVTIWMYISSSLGFRCVCICIRTWSFSATSSPPLCCSSSSWYDVDYSVASPLRFGQCHGCEFAEKSCFSYG